MKNTIYSFQILSLLIILAFSNYSMAQEVSLKKQDIKRIIFMCLVSTKRTRGKWDYMSQVMQMPITTKARSN